jgi:DNA modification methylase
MELINDDFRKCDWPNNIQTIICNPPYNIGFNYKGGYKDRLSTLEYKELIKNMLQIGYERTNVDGSFFIINYPEIIAELFETIKQTDWQVHQWLNWVYPTNVGHSKKKFTRASRTILWLTKDNPKIYIDRVLQPYKNLNDKRIKENIANGRTGTHLYDWWEINLVKNVSKQKHNYTNQIPQELLKRLIFTTTDELDLVADPMCGTGSTLITASKLNRNGWGCDINSDLQELWDNNDI